jgi:hypothetical protein
MTAWSIIDGLPRRAPKVAGPTLDGEGTTGDDQELGGQLGLQPKAGPTALLPVRLEWPPLRVSSHVVRARARAMMSSQTTNGASSGLRSLCRPSLHGLAMGQHAWAIS